MKFPFYIPIIIFFLCRSLLAQDYFDRSMFALTSPGAMKYSLYGYNNPAVLANVESPDLMFAWAISEGEWHDFNNWALFAAIPNISFAVLNEKTARYSATDYKLSAGFGSSSFSIGIGYGWAAGDIKELNRSDIYTLGALIRPWRYLSVGLIGNIMTSSQNELVAETAVRPFGNEFLSLFADYLFRKDKDNLITNWSAGAAAELYPGIRVTGRYFENKFFNLGMELSLGRVGVFSQLAYTDNGKRYNNIYGIRIGAYDRNPFTGLNKGGNYMDVNLLGNINYRRYRLFDNSNTLLELIKAIEAAENDNNISGIALNLSGMNINNEIAWEIREKLKDFKKTGKHIVVYIDRADMQDYYLASVADKIIMDPQGMLMLPGYLMGRQYYAGTLDKIGIGFTELRYFKYKTANESYSRTSLSQADKEQLTEVLNANYVTIKNAICSDRKLTSDEYDKIINEDVMLKAAGALSRKLVDTLARWDDVNIIIKNLEGEYKGFTGPGSLTRFLNPGDNYWGEKPKIAVIYALGVCAMDEGITARELVKDVENAAKDNNIKAIIFRVDSPGGDALASDIVAEALKKAKNNKPVIVSQGRVAASGGYWLSMYGDTIIAAPGTITGSIGVIAGWFYNNGLRQSLGVSDDYVKKGDHADMTFGMYIPFIGLSLPERNLTEDEKSMFQKNIQQSYNEFVSKVSMGRKRSTAEIEKIAQGRVWSGNAGITNGLVDVIGGLDKAIEIAEEKSGLKGKDYELTELPEMPLINWGALLPNPFNIMRTGTLQLNSSFDNLLFRIKNNGLPMPILPLEDYFMYEPQY